MALCALEFVWTSVAVLSYEVARLPFRTRLRVVFVDIRSTPEVLPVVRVDAQSFIVRSEVEGTPHGLVMEHVEVGIKDEIVDEFSFYFILGMSKTAELAVFAFVYLIWIL